jgi:hypothetical protein
VQCSRACGVGGCRGGGLEHDVESRGGGLRRLCSIISMVQGCGLSQLGWRPWPWGWQGSRLGRRFLEGVVGFYVRVAAPDELVDGHGLRMEALCSLGYELAFVRHCSSRASDNMSGGGLGRWWSWLIVQGATKQRQVGA